MSAEMSGPVQTAFPILGALTFLPLLGMAVAFFARSQRQAFLVGTLSAGLELGLALYLLSAFDADSSRLQFTEHYRFLSVFGLHFGVDGLSVLFIAVTALLGLLLMLYGEVAQERSPGLYVANLLAFQAALMGLFESVNLLQFWLLSCVELIPATAILKLWGTHRDKERAVALYLQFMASGLLMVLAGTLLLGWNHASATGTWSFEPAALLRTPPPPLLQSMAFVLIFYGLAIRLAQFPFHAWLPEISQHGTHATLGVLLVGAKVGIYALLRFVLPLLPEAVHFFKPLVVGLGLTGVFYGALLALMQLSLRRLLAFAVVSQTGMLVLGIFSLNREGLAGALLLSVDFGLAAAGLLFSAGLLLRRAGSALLPRLGGLFDFMPVLAITFLISALSTMAMPGTPSFDAAHLLLEGTIEAHASGVAVAVAAGNVLAAAFLLYAFQRTFLAQRRETAIRPVRTRMTLPEATLTGIVCLVLLGMGFYVEPWLKIVDKSVSGLAENFGIAKESPPAPTSKVR
jgi:NADH-quinone oxidoreductase subunit M